MTAASWLRGELYIAGLHLGTYANSTTYFDHSDWLGTIRAWSSAAGSRVGTCTSLPFGDALTCAGTMPSPLNFTGEPLDSESNLTHFWFRQFSTTEGRWTVPDPAGVGTADISNAQTWNRYAYTINSPCSGYDVYGLDVCKLAVKVTGNLPKGVDPASVVSTLNTAFGSQFSFSLATGAAADFTVTSNNALSQYGSGTMGYAPPNSPQIQLDGSAITNEWNSLQGLVPPPDTAVVWPI